MMSRDNEYPVASTNASLGSSIYNTSSSIRSECLTPGSITCSGITTRSLGGSLGSSITPASSSSLPVSCASSVKSIPPTNQSCSIEQAILSSEEEPISIDTTETITANGETGLWLNKAEEENFKGPIPLKSYPINTDSAPLVINKKSKQIECKRQVIVKYLEPPKITTPGPIIVNQEQNILPPQAPPIIIRQLPKKPATPEALVIRELPPHLPTPPPAKVITLPGKLLPPPARKLVIERLPELPDKPQDVHIERWLPFRDVKRRVTLNPRPADPVAPKPRNIIISWEKMKCSRVNTEIKNLGVEKADPNAYVQKYGRANLKKKCEMPAEIVNQVEKEHNIQLAATNTKPYYMELEGDIHALAMIDLDKEGLSEYKSFFEKYQYENKLYY